jgi:hypothetical protein
MTCLDPCGVVFVRGGAAYDFFHRTEKYHNRLRRPSSLGKKTPVDLENQRH